MSPPANAPQSSKLRTIPLTYDPTPANSDSSARALVFTLFPDWETSAGEVEFVRFKDGITNTLFKAIKRRPGYTQHQIDEEAVLLRAYGNGTDMIIDREREARSHALLAQHSLAPALLARFQNGLLYRFIEGMPCTPEDLRKPNIARATARRMGEWHGIISVPKAAAAAQADHEKWDKIGSVILDKPVPNVWTVLRRWIAALPSETEELRKRNSLLTHELEAMTKRFGNAEGLEHGKYVTSHCDLLSGNVIIQPTLDDRADAEKEVSFIDYEYTTPAPASFDLANHFAEWGGFDCDYSVLPTVSQRRDFLRSYVSSFRNNNSSTKQTGLSGADEAEDATGASSPASSTGSAISEDEDVDVSRLMAEVDAFRGIPGLFWGVWGLIQATISQIDFDYASYAETRLGEYWDWKAEADGSRKAAGREMPLRERRWASP